MIQIKAFARLSPKVGTCHLTNPRRAFIIEAVGFATVVLSVAALVVLFSAL